MSKSGVSSVLLVKFTFDLEEWEKGFLKVTGQKKIVQVLSKVQKIRPEPPECINLGPMKRLE